MEVPDAPTPAGLDLLTPSSMRYKFTENSNGGFPVLEWELAYGTHPRSPENTITVLNNAVVENLLPNKEYFFWCRGRNINGWGAWSESISAKTRMGVYVKVMGEWKMAIAYVKIGDIWQPAQPYIRNAGVWKKAM